MESNQNMQRNKENKGIKSSQINTWKIEVSKELNELNQTNTWK